MSTVTVTVPAVTAVWTAIHAVVLLGLAGYVLRLRLAMSKFAPGVNDKGGRLDPLFLAQRTHGNALEYIPLAATLSALAELCGAPHWLLHVAHVMLVVGRVMVSNGLLTGGHRRYGIITTFIATILLAALCVGAVAGTFVGVLFCVGAVVLISAIILAGNKPGRLKAAATPAAEH